MPSAGSNSSSSFFTFFRLDLAKLEAEICTLKFAALAQQEAFEAQKEELMRAREHLTIAQEKANLYDEAVDRMVGLFFSFFLICFHNCLDSDGGVFE